MKIAIVHSFYRSAGPSGENVVVERQMNALRHAGHEVLLVSQNSDDLGSSFAATARLGVNIALGRGINPVEELERFSPDVIHVHNLFPNFSTRWLRDWRGPMVATLHNFRAVCSAGTLFRDGHECTDCPSTGSTRHAIANRCYRNSVRATIPLAIRTHGGFSSDPLSARADVVLALSPRAKSMFVTFGLDESKVKVIENSVPANPCKSNPENSPWIFVGRLVQEKGILDLLDNWDESQRLDVYGDGPLRNEIIKRSSSTIRYMGSRNSSEMQKVMSDAVGLIFPSQWAEGAVPLVYVEALAAGTPTISIRGNGAADDIVAGGTGIVLNDWGELDDALRAITADRTRFSERGRERHSQYYSDQVWVQRIEEVYSGL